MHERRQMEEEINGCLFLRPSVPHMQHDGHIRWWWFFLWQNLVLISIVYIFLKGYKKKEGVIRLGKTKIFPSAIQHAFILNSMLSLKCISGIITITAPAKITEYAEVLWNLCTHQKPESTRVHRHSWESFPLNIFKQCCQSSQMNLLFFTMKQAQAVQARLCVYLPQHWCFIFFLRFLFFFF